MSETGINICMQELSGSLNSLITTSWVKVYDIAKAENSLTARN